MKSAFIRMVPHRFNRYPLGLVSTYLCTNYRTEEFIIALANYDVSQGVQVTYEPDISFERWPFVFANF